MIPHVGNGGVAYFCALLRSLGCWKVSTNPQITTTTLEDLHDVVRIVERIEQATKRGKIEDSTKDDSDDGKPYLCGPNRSHCSINY